MKQREAIANINIKRYTNPNYIEINLENYKKNIELSKKKSGSDIILIVKSDAYGHGLKSLSEYTYKECGIRHFGVATLDEAISIRNILKDAVIFVLGYTDPLYLEDAISNNIILNVFDYNIANLYNNYLTKIRKNINIILKIETGMNRLGFDPNLNIHNFIDKYKRLRIVHIMSHLASADSSIEYSNMQISKFKDVVKNFKFNTSLFNSAGICNLGNNQFSFTRPGIMTYGYVESNNNIPLKRVLSLYSKVIHVKNVKAGEMISYNGTYTAKKNIKIGILPIGYGDGLKRALSNKGYVFIGGKKCDIIGRICMNLAVVDVTNIPDNLLNEPVEIIGDNIDANSMAKLCDTIPYEILTSFSKSIKKIYKR
ncbi:MAG: alanine racemase [Deferribacterota bacterium]|nr:alanine racemase [Deferribacterota bacterium]